MAKLSKVAIKAQEILCPRCEKNTYTPYDGEYVHGVSAPFPALSRVDNKTHICSPCGAEEALLGLVRPQ